MSGGRKTSVIIGMCTCNRGPLLQLALEHVARIEWDGPGEYELAMIVVDNAPDGKARVTCDTVRAQMPFPLHFVEEHERGASHARNRVVREMLECDGDFLAFLDDDDRVEPDWLAQLLRRQVETGADIVMGSFIDELPDDPPQAFEEKHRRLLKRAEKPIWNRFGLPNAMATCNVLIARSVLEKLTIAGNAFDPTFSMTLGEDSDFFMRARKVGARFARARGSAIHYRIPPERTSATARFRHRFKMGRAEAKLVHLHLAPTQRRRWIGYVCWRLIRSTLLLPVQYVAGKDTWPELAGKAGWPFGALLAYFARS
ncbi:MAG: glycosyltransferase [Geminicoccaceae bacterium]|nr:glycosyltransferase [Geminicoccaceae bacterium]